MSILTEIDEIFLYRTLNHRKIMSSIEVTVQSIQERLKTIRSSLVEFRKKVTKILVKMEN